MKPKFYIISSGHFEHKPHCPKCDAVLDAFVHAGDTIERPESGKNHMSVCVYCGIILEFTAQETWAIARPEMIARMEREAPEQFNLLMMYLAKYGKVAM
jgi:hypothetical protein